MTSDKMIYICDPHFSATPASRKDNYNESILAKMEYAFKIAAKNECHMLIGGDLTDRSKLPFQDLIALARLFQKYKDSVKVYCIFGNEGHDGLPEISPVHLFKMAGLIEPSELYKDFNGTRVIFAGHNTDLEEMNALYEPSKVNILMTHRTLVTEPVIFEHTLIEDFKTHCEIVTVAHYHPEQGIITRQDGKIFIAPGSLTRRKKTKENVGHVPKMCFISIEDGKVKTKLLSIPCNQDIWVDKSELEVSEEIYYDNLKKEVGNLKSLVDTTDIVGLSLEEALKKFSETLKVNPMTLDYVFKQLSLTN